jgi:hypothetical protein
MTTLWRCPRCPYKTEQPDRVGQVWHQCRPAGRTSRVIALIADSQPAAGETNQPTQPKGTRNANR